MATFKDIAERCNTSTATVSYVLSGRGEERRISPAMCEQIIAAAKDLNYHYTPKTKKNTATRIAVFWPQKHLDMLMPSFIEGMNSALFMSTSEVEVSIHPYERGLLRNQRALWTYGSFASAVVVSAAAPDLDTLASEMTLVPTVLLNRTLPGYMSVSIDQEEAGSMAAEYAMSHGKDDIAIVMPAANLHGAVTRGNAAIEACRQKGYDISQNVVLCNNDVDDGYATAQRMIMNRSLKKVILCIYDIVAFGIISALTEAGIKVGEDVEVICMSTSHDRLFSRIYPGMTMIDMRQAEVANMGINLAIDAAVNGRRDPKSIILHPQFINRRYV